MRVATLLNRSLSLLVVAAWIVIGVKTGDSTQASPVLPGICAIAFLGLIWFGDQIGSFTGYVGRGGTVDCESPGWLVCSLGWFLLVGLPIILHVVD